MPYVSNSGNPGSRNPLDCEPLKTGYEEIVNKVYGHDCLEKLIREKQHRLPKELYRGFRVVSLCACIKNRIPFFTTPYRFTICKEMLHITLEQFECEADVYMFMPDHVHLLLRGVSETADVLHVMRSFKRKTGFWLSQNHPSVHWQKGFYDHIIRNDETINRHIRYILDNPVRKGLVDDWKKYEFEGSTIHNLNEWEYL